MVNRADRCHNQPGLDAIGALSELEVPEDPGMTVFVIGCVLLVIGYTVYGGLIERAVRPDPERVTPAIALAPMGQLW